MSIKTTLKKKKTISNTFLKLCQELNNLKCVFLNLNHNIKTLNKHNKNIWNTKIRSYRKLSFEKLSPRYGHQAQKDHSEGHAAYHSLRNGFYGYPVTEANCRRKRSWTVGYGRRQLSRNPPTVIFFVFFFIFLFATNR